MRSRKKRKQGRHETVTSEDAVRGWAPRMNVGIPPLPGLIGPGVLDAVMRYLRETYPWYPPCDGGIIVVAASGWRCYQGFISFVDTVTWRCPDGRTVTKEAAAITTDVAC